MSRMMMNLKKSSSIEDVAKFIQSDCCESIIVLTGAGMSVGAGIPDFRSPGGMYNTLKPHLLTATEDEKLQMELDPASVVEKSMFFNNPLPYHEVRRPFIIGTYEEKWKATIAHRVLEIINKHTNKIKRIYTQNIDGLDHQLSAHIPNDRICCVHGTIKTSHCESCGAIANQSEYIEKVKTQIKDIYNIDPTAPKESTPIECQSCGLATVKPSTVLFGGAMPTSFFTNKVVDLQPPVNDEGEQKKMKLLLVAGTSLVVSPANTLVSDAPKSSFHRVIINKELVGRGLGLNFNNPDSNDTFLQGDCDAIFLELLQKLSYLSEISTYSSTFTPEAQALINSYNNNNNNSTQL